MPETTLTAVLNQLLLAQAEGGAPAEPQQNPFGGPFMFIMIGFFFIFYFFMIRPQRKQEQKRQEMLSALAKGDRVMTNGGILGTIVGISDKSIVLRVSDEPNLKIEFVKGAVTRVLDKEDEK